MFDVRISKSSLSKDFKFKVKFPNWQELCGEVPTVNMIVLSDKSMLFDTNDIMYAINEYDNGRVGVNYNQVRKVITGYNGYGRVVFFRRGGIYADIQALKHILKHIFSEQRLEVPKYCTIAHPSVLAALMSCPLNKYAEMDVSAELRFPLDSMVSVVPSTVCVTKKEGVVGVPLVEKQAAEVSEELEEDIQDNTNTDPQAEVKSVEGPQSVDFSPLATFSAMQELIRQLSGGKKIVITLGLE